MKSDPNHIASRPPAVAYAILVASALMLSSNLVIGRAALETVPPWTLAFLRWALAASVLSVIGWPDLRRHAAELRAAVLPILALGFLGMVICGGAVYASLRFTTATNGTLIYSATPVLIVLLEFGFRGQRASLRQMIGIVLAALGIVVIMFDGDPARLMRFSFNPGDLGIAAGALSWAVYSVVLRRQKLQRLPTMVLFSAIAIAGAGLLLPVSLVELAAGSSPPTGASEWVAVVALALIPSIGAFSAYQYSVKRLGPTVTGSGLYLMPVFGVLLAVLVLGEAFHPYHAAGLLLILLGVALATAQRAR